MVKQHAIQVRAVILGGGVGQRLMPLTGKRPKPNMPLEKRRLIDFPISSCVNSACVQSVDVLAQAWANKLNRHIEDTYLTGNARKQVRCQVVPMLTGQEFFAGTADAVRQSEYLFETSHKDMLILSGDHLYCMDYDPLVAYHRHQEAAITIVVQRMPIIEAANRFGVFRLNTAGGVVGFDEKPSNPSRIPDTESCFASLGIYVFNVEKLKELLSACKGNDFGKDIIPYAIRQGLKIALWEYNDYWRDIGTIGSLWQANMDLLGPAPAINLYDKEWPIYHRVMHLPSPKFVNGCTIQDSIVSDGSIIAGKIVSSVISSRVRIGSSASIHESVIMDMTEIANGASLTKVIVDKNCRIGNIVLGQDPETEAQKYPEIELIDGVIVVPRDTVLG